MVTAQSSREAWRRPGTGVLRAGLEVVFAQANTQVFHAIQNLHNGVSEVLRVSTR